MADGHSGPGPNPIYLNKHCPLHFRFSSSYPIGTYIPPLSHRLLCDYTNHLVTEAPEVTFISIPPDRTVPRISTPMTSFAWTYWESKVGAPFRTSRASEWVSRACKQGTRRTHAHLATKSLCRGIPSGQGIFGSSMRMRQCDAARHIRIWRRELDHDYLIPSMKGMLRGYRGFSHGVAC